VDRLTNDAGKSPGWTACVPSKTIQTAAPLNGAEKQDRHDGVVSDGVVGAKFINAGKQCQYEAGNYPMHKNTGQAASLSVVFIRGFVAADVSRLKLLSTRSEPTDVGCYDP
jgi:hypothetical protein